MESEKSKEVKSDETKSVVLFFDHDKRKMMTFGKDGCNHFF